MATSFEELGLSRELLKAIEDLGFEEPSPIQILAVPCLLAGTDAFGQAQTGTGKTAAFALPILQQLANRPAKQPKAIRALVLTPTRELAIQVGENFTCYSAQLPLKTTTIFGGVSQFHQVKAVYWDRHLS